MKIKKYILFFAGVILLCSITSSLNALDIYGVYVLGENYVLNDDLHIHPEGVIMNEHGDDYVTLTVYGNIINEGTITNNSAGGSLTIRANANVTNDGTWDCISTYLDGSAVQHISCLNAHSFQSPNFYNNNANNIIADDDIYFSGANVQWQNNGSLDISAGYDLHIDQGRLYQADILGGNASEINMSGNAYLYNVNADNVVLSGTVNIYGSITFTDNVTNTGVLQNRSGGSYILTVNGNLNNTGTIQNNGSSVLYIDITGDVTNNGIWQNYDIELIGTTDQHISCGLGNMLEPTWFRGNSSRGSIYFDTDVAFAGTEVNLNDDNLILGIGTTLSLSGGNLRNGTVTADNAVLNMTDDAYLYTVEIENAELQGICQINNNGVVFSGTTTVTGTLRNKYSYGQSVTTTVNGDIVNNGTITDYSGNHLFIDIAGNIINNGIWQNYDIELIGTSDQHISCPTDSSFVISYFRGNLSRGNIYFDTDIEFVGTTIDLNSDNLILQADNTLTLTGGRITDGFVTADNAVLIMTGDADLYDVEIENAEFQGVCQVYGSDVVFSGATTVTEILQNKHSYSSTFTLTLNGEITNNGTIRNGSTTSQLSIHIPGDIQINNNGIWQNYDIELIGTTDQHISCSGAGSFAISHFYGNSSRGNIYFDTDIEFVGTNIYLNDDNLILQEGNILTLSGVNLRNGTIAANNAVLNMSDSAYLYDIDIENSELQGTCQVNSNVNLIGTTTVTGILQNTHSYNSTFTLTINGDIVNNGTIRNGSTSSNLSINITGDIVNNGIWQNTDIEPIGISDQHISCSAGSSFALTYFYGNIFGGNVTLISDIEFIGTNIDLNSDNLNLQEGNTLTLTGGYLQDGTVTANNAVLNMTDDAYLQDVNFANAELLGTCQINGNSVTFNGTTTVTGTLQNKHSYQTAYTLSVNGDIVNNGTIRNAYSSSYLFLDITGNIVSNGSWSNYRTSLNGTSDQTISLENSNYLTGDVRFVSDIAGTTYQWNFNSAPLDSPNFAGETTIELDWNVPVSSDYAGTYNCDVGRTLSRNIIVSIPPPDAPQNVIISITGSNVEISWTAVTGATSYTVYSDSNPYGNFGTVEYTGADSSCSLLITEDNKFYRVTASN